jgi:ribosomal-protein-alanine N-acetyltransferase
MEEVELGYELTPGAWGRGLATEAAWAYLRYAFEKTNLERAIARVDSPNIASLRVIEKLGMKPVESADPRGPGEPCYALYREDFSVAADTNMRGPAREQKKEA